MRDRDSTQQIKALVTKAAAGDEQARTQLFADYWSYIRDAVRGGKRSIGQMLSAREETQDLTQQAAVRILHELQNYQWQSKPAFMAWMKKLARGTVVDTARHHKAGKRDVGADATLHDASPSEEDDPETQAVFRERLEAMLGRLQKLKKEQALAIVMFHTGHTHAEIAEALGTTPEATRKVINRAMAKLRKG